MEIWEGGLTELGTKLVDIALRDRVFAVGDGLNFNSEVGAPGNVKFNEYVTRRGHGEACILTRESEWPPLCPPATSISRGTMGKYDQE